MLNTVHLLQTLQQAAAIFINETKVPIPEGSLEAMEALFDDETEAGLTSSNATAHSTYINTLRLAAPLLVRNRC